MKESRIGIGVVIIRNKKVLLGKRKNTHWAGTWCLPGGRLQLNETSEDCGVREVLEETGMKVDNLKLVSVSNDIMYDQHWVTIGLLAKKAKGNPTLKEPEKCEKWGWFDFDNLPKPLFIASKRVIEKILEDNNANN